MSEYQTISYTVINRVATISLNRPEAMNAISQTMRQELKRVIEISENDDAVRVVIIRAEGRGFSSGTDLSEGLSGYETIDDQIQQEYKPVLETIASSTKPYLVSIQGVCAGIGAALAMSCDLAIMSEGAFIYLAFAGLSLVPDGGMAYHMVNAMGYKKAYQAYIESARIPAQECLYYGLVNKVVSDETLAKETTAWAECLATGAPLAQKFGKKIMRKVHCSSLDEIIDMESGIQTSCSTSQDAQSAIKAFFEKKNPSFVGA